MRISERHFAMKDFVNRQVETLSGIVEKAAPEFAHLPSRRRHLKKQVLSEYLRRHPAGSKGRVNIDAQEVIKITRVLIEENHKQ